MYFNKNELRVRVRVRVVVNVCSILKAVISLLLVRCLVMTWEVPIVVETPRMRSNTN